MTKSFKITNLVAFVTGTNHKNGIGRAIVDALLEQGAKKVYATARDVAQLEEFVASSGGKVVAVTLDVANEEQTSKLGEQYPDVNLLVNNAGYAGMTTSLGDPESAVCEMQVNYFGPLNIVCSFAPVLKSKTNTAVVNVASGASFVSFPLGATYLASKAALHSLTQAHCRDLAGSLVIGVYPGPIDTVMAEKNPMKKETPGAVAKVILNALTSGEEDVFPDVMAAHMYELHKADAKALERALANATDFVALERYLRGKN